MARRCDLCGKKAVLGHNVSYSKRRTSRRFMPNLRFMTLNGQRIKTCMKCLKKMKNEGKVGKVSKVEKVAKVEKVKQVVKVERKLKKIKIKKEVEKNGKK